MVGCHKMKFLLNISIGLTLIGCNQSNHHQAHLKKILSANTKNASGNQSERALGEVLLVKNRSAISIILDAAVLNERRKKYGDEAYYVGADDYAYYNAVADSFLKKQNLPVINAGGYRFIKFLRSNRSISRIKTDTLSDIISVYFFEPSKGFYKADITNIEDEYKNFYR